MSLLAIIVYLVIVGVVLYVLNAVVPMDARVKLIVNAVIIIAVCLWVLNAFGLLGGGELWIGPHRR
jgi:hypothetical protein